MIEIIDLILLEWLRFTTSPGFSGRGMRPQYNYEGSKDMHSEDTQNKDMRERTHKQMMENLTPGSLAKELLEYQRLLGKYGFGLPELLWIKDIKARIYAAKHE